MAESFGTRLRLRREERRIDLEAISAQTKIKVALLEGLERDDVSQWPSGIFRRAYIRAYAQIIGLDPDLILREFLDLHPDPGDAFVVTAASAAAAEEEFAKNAPSMRFRTMVDSALGSLTKLRRPPVMDDATPATVPAAIAAEDFDEASAPSAPAQPGLDEVSPIVAVPAEPSVPISEPPMPVTEETPSLPAEPGRQANAPREPEPGEAPSAGEPMLEAIAPLCTELGRAVDAPSVQQLLTHCAAALGATGLIVWVWEDADAVLRPVLVHGYSARLLAHLPPVTEDADNATAAAFRSMKICEVAATPHTSAALVVPMLVPYGCAGVLAIELQQGNEPSRPRRAAATIVTAALTQLVLRLTGASGTRQMDDVAPAGSSGPAGRPIKVRR